VRTARMAFVAVVSMVWLCSAAQAKKPKDEIINLNEKYPEYFAPEVFSEDDIAKSHGFMGEWWAQHVAEREAEREAEAEGKAPRKKQKEEKKQLFSASFSGRCWERDFRKKPGAKPQKVEAGHFNILQIDFVDSYDHPVCVWGLINYTDVPRAPQSLGLRMCMCIKAKESEFEEVKEKLLSGELVLNATFWVWKLETDGRGVGHLRIGVEDFELVPAEGKEEPKKKRGRSKSD
jgi:hypothetical protein